MFKCNERRADKTLKICAEIKNCMLGIKLKMRLIKKISILICSSKHKNIKKTIKSILKIIV